MKIEKKKPSSKTSTREKMMKRKENLSKRSGKGLIFPKVGTLRVRLKSRGSDEELGIEIIQFYLGSELGGVISPATFDEPCPFMEKYEELKASKNASDKALAGKLVPKRKYVIGGDIYKDEKGKELDPDKIGRGIMVGRGVYQDITDYYLDEDEWGDMTDALEGYDIKITRTGSGMTDTSYSVVPCTKKAIDKSRRGDIDLDTIVRNEIKSYEDLEELLDQFLSSKENEDDEDDEPRSTKSGKKSEPSTKKKKLKIRR